MNPVPKQLDDTDRPMMIADCREIRRSSKWFSGILITVFLCVLGWMMVAIQSAVNSVAAGKEQAETMFRATDARSLDNQQAIRVIEATMKRVDDGVGEVKAEQIRNRDLLMKIATQIKN